MSFFLEEIKNLFGRVFFVFLLIWISFFPSPIQNKYEFASRIFFFSFLFFLLLAPSYRKNLFSRKDIPFWLFLLCLLGGLIPAIDKNIAMRTYIYFFGALVPLFYIGKSLYGNEKDKNCISWVIFISALLVVFIGFLELLFNKNFLYEKFIHNPFYGNRYYGIGLKIFRPLTSTQFCPAVLGTYLVGCLSFCFFGLKRKLLSLRLVSFLSLLLWLIVVFFTFSRAALVAFLVSLLFYLWQIKRKVLFLIIVFFVFIGSLALSQQKDSGLRRFGNREVFFQGGGLSQYRLRKAKLTWRVLKKFPIFGIGLNHVRERYCEFSNSANRNCVPHWAKILDNMYLTILAETGLLGFLGFCIFIFYLVSRGIRCLWSPNKDIHTKQELLLPLVALIGILVNMVGYETLYWSSPLMLFSLICGLMQGAICKYEEEKCSIKL